MKKGKIILFAISLFIISSIITYCIVTIICKFNKADMVPLDIENTQGDYKSDDELGENRNRSPLSGLYTDKSLDDIRPVAVMFDNHPGARWQSSINQAEILYEFPVEDPYTRYIGIYLINEPESIGPVRSTRPYFVETILQYNPIYVRCGGSEDGKEYVRRYGVSDIDGLTSKSFWRNNQKRSPHNLYTSMSNIRKEQEEMKYNSYREFEGYNFYKKDTNIDGDNAESVLIKYNDNNNTKYLYNAEKRIYERYKDGDLHIDESDKSTVYAKNIIIQKVNSRTIDDEGRKKINVIGSGEAYYITNGKVQEITWRKGNANSKTVYSDASGSEITFNSGITWIQVVPIDSYIDIN